MQSVRAFRTSEIVRAMKFPPILYRSPCETLAHIESEIETAAVRTIAARVMPADWRPAIVASIDKPAIKPYSAALAPALPKINFLIAGSSIYSITECVRSLNHDQQNTNVAIKLCHKKIKRK